MKEKAILVVSFGTSHKDTREKTIEVLENEIKGQMPDYELYRAFTSKIIIKVIEKQEGFHINNVTEAMEAMKADGVKEVIVQPTHIINGVENDAMIRDVLKYEEDFESILFGQPLLNKTKDYLKVVEAITEILPKPDKEQAVVLMGHGTSHYTNSCYAALDFMFKHYHYDNVYVAAVEAFPHIEDIIPKMRKHNYKKVLLLPLMVVAGEHAKNDMIGEEEDSWLNQLKREGYEVDYLLKGLGEYEKIRHIYYEHIKEAKPLDVE